MNVTVSRERCIGSGLCCVAAPAVFDQDHINGLVMLRNKDDYPLASAAVREAAYLCPSGAIEIS